MAETVKEKAMRAWAQEKHVEIITDDKPDLNGVVSEFHSDRLYLKGHEWTEQYYYHNIADIRFLGEEKAIEADDGSILGDFQKERTAALSEMFDSPDPETSIYPTSAFYGRLDRAVEKALERQRHAIDSTITIGDDSEPEKEPEPSILLEEWEIGEQLGDTLPIVNRGEQVASAWSRRFAVPITALPNALRALKMVCDNTLIVNFGTAGKRISVGFSEDEWQIVTDALKKAGIE